MPASDWIVRIDTPAGPRRMVDLSRAASACPSLVRAVIAESFERIHRANLALVGVLPVEWIEPPAPAIARGDRVSIPVAPAEVTPGAPLTVVVDGAAGERRVLRARCRLDTAFELDCWRSGGMLGWAAARAAGQARTGDPGGRPC